MTPPPPTRVNLGSREVPPERRQAFLDQVASKWAVAETPPLVLGYDPKDPRGRAKDASNRLLDMTNVLARMFAAHPAELVFAVELALLNVANADDLNLSPADYDRESREARAYYQRTRQVAKTITRERPPTPARRIRDPLRPWENAIAVAVRLTQFMSAMGREMGLAKPEFVYAVELYGCNFYGYPDFPFAPADTAKVRDEAFAYYTRNRDRARR